MASVCEYSRTTVRTYDISGVGLPFFPSQWYQLILRQSTTFMLEVRGRSCAERMIGFAWGLGFTSACDAGTEIED